MTQITANIRKILSLETKQSRDLLQWTCLQLQLLRLLHR